ncbi:unnamed protein product [Closterium sp. Yama58-4]|nr:unnamed protein product [Closterium sp. Yama58-4]
MIAAPRLAVSSWIRPCEQAAVEVQSVPALPVVALLEEAASTEAELEAVTVDASTGCSLSTANHFGLKPTGFTELLAAEESSVKRRVGKDLPSCRKEWSMEVKGFGKAEEGRIVSIQLFGEEEEEEEDGSSKQSFRTLGTGTMCYMNQLYMDEEEEKEREALAMSGISVGIGRFGARRRITGSSSRVTLRRMSGALRQY